MKEYIYLLLMAAANSTVGTNRGYEEKPINLQLELAMINRDSTKTSQIIFDNVNKFYFENNREKLDFIELASKIIKEKNNLLNISELEKKEAESINHIKQELDTWKLVRRVLLLTPISPTGSSKL